MKLNKKGFMLAEVTVVATLAATVMLVMYASSIKMINAYKARENYYDVDTIYATGYIHNYIIDTYTINNYINTYNINNKKASISDPIISNLINNYKINDIRFIKSKASDVTSLSNSVDNRTFKNYLNNYVKNNVSEKDDEYILIVERKVDNEYYYYSVEV